MKGGKRREWRSRLDVAHAVLVLKACRSETDRFWMRRHMVRGLLDSVINYLTPYRSSPHNKK